MTRLAILAIAGLVGVGTAAPTPRDASLPGPYFPIREGAEWVYQTSSPGEPGGTQIKRVSAVERITDGHNVRVGSVNPAHPKTCFPLGDLTIRVTLSGLAVVCGHADEWATLLPEDHRSGVKTAYRYNTTDNKHPVVRRGTIVTHGVDAVKVPAGVFRAVRVEQEGWTEVPDNGLYVRDEKRGVTHVTTWYAVGIGPVKYIVQSEGKPPILAELRSFTPGKP